MDCKFKLSRAPGNRNDNFTDVIFTWTLERITHPSFKYGSYIFVSYIPLYVI